MDSVTMFPYNNLFLIFTSSTASVDKRSELLATDPEVPVSILGATIFSEK
jgi:hypothetical protein